MSRRWEESVNEWYTKSHTANLEYLDLSVNKNPTQKELGHNLSVIYDRVCLSSRVHLKNFKKLIEELSSLEEKWKQFQQKLQKLESLFREPKLTEQQSLKSLEIILEKLEKIEKRLQKIEAWVST
ncbi:ORF1 [Aglaonema bacilliform virus]|uniref:ORF1 n=1 Tax=Aglaonema bacilliform virus TaxID=1512278 RepID=A0A411F6N3_9VIRU|nr:ORF1 [Aglaonema bacilliform virus]QBA88841.1 ORF1 [Aglaonema bacilliform virus]